jgi:hypothetical protein
MTTYRSLLARELRAFAPTRDEIRKEVSKPLYKGWTFVLFVCFLFLRLAKHTPFRGIAVRALENDRRFLEIVRSRKSQIQESWKEYERLFFENEECNCRTGCFDASIGREEDAAKSKAKELVQKTLSQLASSGWQYPPIESKIQGHPGWITTEACVRVWDEVERFLLHRIWALEA